MRKINSYLELGSPEKLPGTQMPPKHEWPTLDFLFVDYWAEYNYDALDGNILIIQDDANPNWYIYKMIGTVLTQIAGINSIPFVPISQTTIFIHPTTFQRYMFNGTTMVEYDDVDGVVPKWLKYEALLTQSGENAPVARVLNADERDYLGEVIWSYVSDGGYLGSNNRLMDLIGYVLLTHTDLNFLQSNSILKEYIGIHNNEILLFTNNGDYFTSNDLLNNNVISIKQRVRGNPPKLISAETNTVGDKVILTFDKEMSGYGYIPDFQPFQIFNVTQEQQPVFYDTPVVVNGNTVLISTNNNNVIINSGDIVTIAYNDVTESLDYGLLQPFTDFIVINNVPAPPEIFGVTYTNGGVIEIEFNKNMLPAENPRIRVYYSEDYTIVDYYDENGNPVYMTNANFIEFILTNLNNVGDKILSCTVPANMSDAYGVVLDNIAEEIQIFSVDGGKLPNFATLQITNKII